MDPSALIFIALAVAWAAYLLPQAIKHHDAVQRTRSVERFSSRMRVLARREPTSSKDARLVVTPERVVQRPKVEVKPARQAPAVAPVVASRPASRPVSAAARRAAANAAARRRRNVLSLLVTAVVVVAALAFGGLFSPRWIGVPVAVVVAWLVACRLMVKQERRVEVPVAPQALVEDEEPAPVTPVRVEIHDETGEIVAVTVDDDPSRWDMVPVTLPTYVTKPAAEQPRVSTIDLDSTGVWTSGRTEVDAEIARQAEERRRAGNRIAEARQQQRAVGS